MEVPSCPILALTSYSAVPSIQYGAIFQPHAAPYSDRILRRIKASYGVVFGLPKRFRQRRQASAMSAPRPRISVPQFSSHCLSSAARSSCRHCPAPCSVGRRG
jgi:hypothetical protein